MKAQESQVGPRTARPSLRREVLRQRYLLKDAQGNVLETPRQMPLRVAKAVAAIEAQYGADPEEVRAVAQQFFWMMRRMLFLPNSPTLINAGRKEGMCCACFVLEVEDSVESIFEAVKQTSLIQKIRWRHRFCLR